MYRIGGSGYWQNDMWRQGWYLTPSPYSVSSCSANTFIPSLNLCHKRNYSRNHSISNMDHLTFQLHQHKDLQLRYLWNLKIQLTKNKLVNTCKQFLVPGKLSYASIRRKIDLTEDFLWLLFIKFWQCFHFFFLIIITFIDDTVLRPINVDC